MSGRQPCADQDASGPESEPVAGRDISPAGLNESHLRGRVIGDNPGYRVIGAANKAVEAIEDIDGLSGLGAVSHTAHVPRHPRPVGLAYGPWSRAYRSPVAGLPHMARLQGGGGLRDTPGSKARIRFRSWDARSHLGGGVAIPSSPWSPSPTP